jgi:hypothetical protein
MARSLTRVIAETRQPSSGRPGIIDRRAVRDAEDAIEALVSRLIAREPVSVHAMARVERLLTSGDSSPLYVWSAPGALRREVEVARLILDSSLVERPIAA